MRASSMLVCAVALAIATGCHYRYDCDRDDWDDRDDCEDGRCGPRADAGRTPGLDAGSPPVSETDAGPRPPAPGYSSDTH